MSKDSRAHAAARRTEYAEWQKLKEYCEQQGLKSDEVLAAIERYQVANTNSALTTFSVEFTELPTTEQVAIVWNNMMTKIVKPIEETWSATNEIELLIEKIRSLFAHTNARHRHTHTEAIASLKEYSEKLAQWLAWVDPFNRALGALAQQEIDPSVSPYYIDLGYAHQVYNATQNFVNRLPDAEEALRDVLHTDADMRRKITISKALKPRQRPPKVDYDGIYSRVEALKTDGYSVVEATQIIEDEEGTYDAETYRRYYNREAGRRKNQANNR